MSSVADKRGRSIDVSDLEELLSGCTQLEVRLHCTNGFFRNILDITNLPNLKITCSIKKNPSF